MSSSSQQSALLNKISVKCYTKRQKNYIQLNQLPAPDQNSWPGVTNLFETVSYFLCTD